MSWKSIACVSSTTRYGSIFQCPAKCTSTKQPELSKRENVPSQPAVQRRHAQKKAFLSNPTIWCRERRAMDTAHCSRSAATKNNQTRLARECRMSTTANWKPIHGSFAALLCFSLGTMARTVFQQPAAREKFQIKFYSRLGFVKNLSALDNTCLLICSPRIIITSFGD